MSLMTVSPAQKIPFDRLPKFRAPLRDREALVTPSLSGLIHRAYRDLHRAAADDASSAGVSELFVGRWPLERLRRSARRDALAAAIEHTAAYRPLWFDGQTYLAEAEHRPWLVAGHQPELFHCGVWFKNFLLSQAGQRTGIVPLNLVIDNDLCRSAAIRVLTRGADGTEPLRTETVVFDAPSPPVAWECRPLIDRATFDTFPERVRQVLIQQDQYPLVEHLWTYARAASRRTGRLGLAIAEARHALEGELGLQTLELPLSRLCEQPSFARFSLALLQELPRFHQIYNQQRAAYRAANHVRSESHPVQALASRHGWLEAPWWIYRSSTPARKRLFARLESGHLLLSDQAGWQTTIEGPLDDDDAASQWQEFAIDGVLLRPRALITTMFARLVVSDLFVHGIGGGKYDQLTDAIVREFFAIEPPPMCVATATLHLPAAAASVDGSLSENRGATQHEIDTLRQLRYHPEENIEADHAQASHAEVQRLLETKRQLLRSIPPRGEKWEWHRQMTRINARLAELNRAAMQRSEQRLHSLAVRERQLKLAYSRELSFCLFELPYVADVLGGLAAQEFEHPVAK